MNDNIIKANEELKNARLRAKMITSAAKEQYQTEVANLKLFIERFNAYAQDVVNNYPSDVTRKTVAVGKLIKEILNREESPEFTSREKIKEIYTLLKDVKPKKKSLYGEGVNGFSMDDVLNPKEDLDLEALLKELGVRK